MQVKVTYLRILACWSSIRTTETEHTSVNIHTLYTVHTSIDHTIIISLALVIVFVLGQASDGRVLITQHRTKIKLKACKG